MNTLRDIRLTFYRKIPLFAGLCLCLYFSYHTVSGQRSYTRLSTLTSVSLEKQKTLDVLRQEKGSVQARVVRMRPASFSADMLEERVRFVLGYKHRDEVIVLGH